MAPEQHAYATNILAKSGHWKNILHRTTCKRPFYVYFRSQPDRFYLPFTQLRYVLELEDSWTDDKTLLRKFGVSVYVHTSGHWSGGQRQADKKRHDHSQSVVGPTNRE